MQPILQLLLIPNTMYYSWARRVIILTVAQQICTPYLLIIEVGVTGELVKGT